MVKIFLKSRISHRIERGHPWIFGNEIERIEGEPAGGEIVDVFFHNRKFAGRGYINPKSQIAVRLLTWDKSEQINHEFFFRRIRDAWQYRIKIGFKNSFRLVFGEADFLPALVIDKFEGYFVLQTLSLGMDKWKETIVAVLNDLFRPLGIYERNDVPVRELEGLTQVKGFLSEPFDTRIRIEENGLQFLVDVENGQKTGYFLDQQENRKEIRHIVKGAEVLGAFSYTGSFEVQAAHFGAKNVLGFDISPLAVEMANQNAALNGMEASCRFEQANAFDILKKFTRDKSSFDVVMLDPPAFTKSMENIENAVRGYKEINLRGIKLVKPGGFLVTSSCTNLVSPELFLSTIDSAAHDAKRKLRQVVFRTQSPDHPIMSNLENTNYLKFLIAEIL